MNAVVARGPYPRFSPAAIERAKEVLGIDDVDKVGIALGYSRAGFYRVRAGISDPRLSDARRVSRRLDMPIDQVFIGGSNA